VLQLLPCDCDNQEIKLKKSWKEEKKIIKNQKREANELPLSLPGYAIPIYLH
jgi:hypothetical protein